MVEVGEGEGEKVVRYMVNRENEVWHQNMHIKGQAVVMNVPMDH